MQNFRLPRAGRALLLAAAAGTAIVPPAAANGVDGAGRIVIVPLVMKAPGIESLVTATNTGPQRLVISSTLYPADGTAPTGTVIPCSDFDLEPWGSRSTRLEDLCGRLNPD